MANCPQFSPADGLKALVVQAITSMLLPRLGGLLGALTGAADCTSPVILAACSSSVLRSSRSDICAEICADA